LRHPQGRCQTGPCGTEERKRRLIFFNRKDRKSTKILNASLCSFCLCGLFIWRREVEKDRESVTERIRQGGNSRTCQGALRTRCRTDLDRRYSNRSQRCGLESAGRLLFDRFSRDPGRTGEDAPSK